VSTSRRFDYHQFLTTLKTYTIETVITIIAIIWVIDHALKLIQPQIHDIIQFFHSP
jgi:hypothetical protein